jgi:Ca2+-dependent lipid-binding protein
VEVIEAKLIRDTEMFGKMDPFVKITYDLSKLTYKTRAIDNGGKNVQWNETFTINLKSTTEGELRV